MFHDEKSCFSLFKPKFNEVFCTCRVLSIKLDEWNANYEAGENDWFEAGAARWVWGVHGSREVAWNWSGSQTITLSIYLILANCGKCSLDVMKTSKVGEIGNTSHRPERRVSQKRSGISTVCRCSSPRQTAARSGSPGGSVSPPQSQLPLIFRPWSHWSPLVVKNISGSQLPFKMSSWSRQSHSFWFELADSHWITEYFVLGP